ncbi:hypothetical protein WR25_00485 [Diploscapter pachys]|uniref:Cytochrome P450 n=1 Tax=Diploscapter pachys TaxID=2018661 RepID=A0A2A2KJL2_9BILA|nr:hypothetical protein WR25_00485 [Diploscapter pachys]
MLLYSLFICFLVYFVIKHIFKVRKYPSGPLSLPIIGSAFQLGYYTFITGSLHEAFKKCRKEYGDIFTLWLGPYPVILICDYDLAMEAMIKHGNNFVDRWNFPANEMLRNNHGLIESNGEYWVEQRRFALHTLRNLGVSRRIMEDRIIDEFHSRFGDIKSEKTIDANETFDLFTANVINRILFSYGFDEKNQDKFYALKKKMDYQIENISFLRACISQFFPKLSYFKKNLDSILEPFINVKKFLEEQILERVEAIKNGSHEIPDEANDYVDAFLKEMDKLDKAGTKSSFSLEALVIDVFDLYVAGQETTSTTLAWAMIYLLNHPDVTDRVRKELREVTDGSRDLSQNDKPKTPYFNATINEIQRLGNIVTINLFRRAAEDLQLGGVTIRKGQTVTAQISMVMDDEKYFEEPNKFNPDRYMSDDKLKNQTIPFGIGKRACLGESLARAELYLILGNLIQRYEFEAVDGIPSEQPVNPKSFMRRPEKFKIRLVKIE